MSLDYSQATVHPEKVKPASAVSRWSMDDVDVSGGTIVDSWGPNDGTINGATTGQGGVGYTGESFSLDGVDDYIEIADDFQGVFDNADFTISLWGYFDSYDTGGQYAFGYDDGGGDKWMGIYLDGNGDWYFDSDDGTTKQHLLFGAGTTSSWHHFVATHREGDGYSIYLDGSFVTSASDNGSPWESTNVVTFGQNARSGQYMSGLVDEVRIYSEALSQQQIWHLYSIGSYAPWRLTQA